MTLAKMRMEIESEIAKGEAFGNKESDWIQGCQQGLRFALGLLAAAEKDAEAERQRLSDELREAEVIIAEMVNYIDDNSRPSQAGRLRQAQLIVRKAAAELEANDRSR